MNKLLLFILLGFISQFQAQDTVSMNHYSFSLVNGISFTRSNATAGEEMENAASIFHGINFQYTRNLTQNFSLSGTAGFGFLPFNYKVGAKNGFSGTQFMGYFERVQYQVFSNLALNAGYRNKISERYSWQLSAGLGMKNFPTSYFQIGSADMAGSNYFLKGKFLEQTNPYISVGAGIIRTLQNKDEFSLRLSYEQFFREIYNGEYSLYNNTSSGRLFNTGSNANLALTYTFTGSAKQERLTNLKATDFPESRAAKKQYRKEIRYIDPKSMFISVSAGLGFGINRTKDRGNYLKSGTFASFLPRITFEKGIARNYFVEGGFNTLEFWSVLNTRSQSMSSGSNAFNSYQVSLGAGKRLVTNNNYNIITLHGGLTFGFTDMIKGYQGYSSMAIGSIDSTGQTVNPFIVVAQQYGIRKFMTSAYLGASKDFRITNRFYLALSYRYQQGFYTVYEQRVTYTAPGSTELQDAKIKIDGSSHVFEFGVKVKL